MALDLSLLRYIVVTKLSILKICVLMYTRTDITADTKEVLLNCLTYHPCITRFPFLNSLSFSLVGLLLLLW